MSQLRVKELPLPDLCMRHIFKYLGVRDLASCRAVNRQFRYYAIKQRITKLDLALNPRNRVNRVNINRSDSVNLKTFKTIKRRFKLDKYLQFLRVFLRGINEKILNSLNGLIYLEMHNYDYRTYEPLTLTLPNLRVLKIGDKRLGRYRLCTPKLETLLGHRQYVEVNQPETVKQLASNYWRELASFKNLSMFSGLLRDPGELNPNLLSLWKNLRELNLKVPSFSNRQVYEQFVSSMTNIMKQKEISGQLEIYLNDVRLLDADQLDFDLTNWELKNHKLIRADHRVYLETVNFNVLVHPAAPDLSGDLFVKFPVIRSVEAAGVIDARQFEWFLRNGRELRELKLTDTLLGQTFMESLPEMNSRLTRLQVTERPGSVTDFNFILRLEQLTEFATDQQLECSFDLAAKAFRRLNQLRLFQFREERERVRISRNEGPADSFNLSSESMKKNKTKRPSFEKSRTRWAKLRACWENRRTENGSKKLKADQDRIVTALYDSCTQS